MNQSALAGATIGTGAGATVTKPTPKKRKPVVIKATTPNGQVYRMTWQGAGDPTDADIDSALESMQATHEKAQTAFKGADTKGAVGAKAQPVKQPGQPGLLDYLQNLLPAAAQPIAQAVRGNALGGASIAAKESLNSAAALEQMVSPQLAKARQVAGDTVANIIQPFGVTDEQKFIRKGISKGIQASDPTQMLGMATAAKSAMEAKPGKGGGNIGLDIAKFLADPARNTIKLLAGIDDQLLNRALSGDEDAMAELVGKGAAFVIQSGVGAKAVGAFKGGKSSKAALMALQDAEKAVSDSGALAQGLRGINAEKPVLTGRQAMGPESVPGVTASQVANAPGEGVGTNVDALADAMRKMGMPEEQVRATVAALNPVLEQNPGAIFTVVDQIDPSGKLKQAITHQTSTPQFKEWFGASRIVEPDGTPKVYYSGHSNVDAFGGKFDKRKATSGAFYATSDPDIASNYALSKWGNRETYENGSQYKIVPEKGRAQSIWDVRLTPEQRARFDEWFAERYGENIDSYLKENAPYDREWRTLIHRGGGNNLGTWWKFMEYMGDNVAYAQHGDAPLFERQIKNDFEDLMDMANIKYQDATWNQPGVMPMFISVRNPLVVGDQFPPELLAELKSAGGRVKPDTGSTQWTKEYPLANWVKDIEDGNEFWATQVPAKAVSILRKHGYDGILDKGGKMGGNEHDVVVFFDPTQAKSAIGNRGTFDSTKADMRFQQGKEGIKGAYSPSSRVIELAQGKADVSTVIHEVAHDWHGFLKDHAEHGPVIRQYYGDMTDEAGAEAFARHFERFLMTGKSPAVGLKRVFEAIQGWMKQIYSQWKYGKAPKEVEAIFKRTYTNPSEETMRLVREFEELHASAPEGGSILSSADRHRIYSSSDEELMRVHGAIKDDPDYKDAVSLIESRLRSSNREGTADWVRTNLDGVPPNMPMEEQLRLSIENAQSRKREVDPLAPDASTAPTRTSNKIFTDDALAQARRDLLEGGAGAGLGDLGKKYKALLTIGGYHLEAGVRDFGAWSARVLEDVGEWAKPYLERTWKEAHEAMGEAPPQTGGKMGIGDIPNSTGTPDVPQGDLFAPEVTKSVKAKSNRWKVLDTVGREVQLANPVGRLLDFAANTTRIAGGGIESTLRNLTGVAQRLATKGDTYLVSEHPMGLTKAKRVYGGQKASTLKTRMQGDIKYGHTTYGKGGPFSKLAGIGDVPFREYHYRSMLSDVADNFVKGSGKKGFSNPSNMKSEQVYQSLLSGKAVPGLDVQGMREAAEAYAAHMTYNQDNLASMMIKSVEGSLDQAAETSTHALSAASINAAHYLIFKPMTRYSKVIGNVAIDRFQRSFFGVPALAEAIAKSTIKGGKPLSPYQARYVTNLIGKGGAAAGVGALGVIAVQNGWVKPKIMKTENGTVYVDWGDWEQIGGPAHPFMYSATMAAIDKSSLTDIQKQSAKYKYAVNMLLNQPAVTGPQRAMRASESPGGVVDYVANFMASMVIPGGIRDLAQRMDDYNQTSSQPYNDALPKNRKAKGPAAQFLKKLPGSMARESLPLKNDQRIN